MNLWADFDNNQLLDTSGYERPSPLTERAILSMLRAWLLEGYVASYCRSLGATRIFRRCCWIDALGIDAKASGLTLVPVASESSFKARKGRKKEKEQAVPPALQPIMTLSQQLALEIPPITLRGLFLKKGSSKRKETRQNAIITKDIPPIPTESGILNCSWLEVARPLLKEIEQVPAIFLLNPLGPTLFTYDDLSLLYQRTIPTELCLLIPHKQAETCLKAARRSPKQSAILTGLLRSDRWRTLPTGEEEREQALDGLINVFITSIQRHFLFPVQRIALLAQIRPATIEIAPYTLIFATRRQDSLVHMNDAICMYRRRLNEQSFRGILGEEWFVAQQQERLKFELRQMSQRVLQQGQARCIRHWPDLRQQILLTNFGQFTLQEYDTIMQQLLTSREVRCEWRSRSAGVDGKRLPGNDDILVWK